MSARRLDGQPGAAGAFSVPSASVPDLDWTVVYQPGTDNYCPCPHFARQQRCRHVDEVHEAVKAEHAAIRAAMTPADHEAARRRMQETKEMFAR